MSKAEERALEAYPIKNEWVGNQYGSYGDINEDSREKFIQGYEQAEKDFALTWQNMKAIDQICHDVAFDDIDRQDPIFYNEVLKRFNEQRDESENRRTEKG